MDSRLVRKLKRRICAEQLKDIARVNARKQKNYGEHEPCKMRA